MKKNMIKKGTMDRIELNADLLDGITGGEWGYYVWSDGIPCRTDGKRLVPMAPGMGYPPKPTECPMKNPMLDPRINPLMDPTVECTWDPVNQTWHRRPITPTVVE